MKSNATKILGLIWVLGLLVAALAMNERDGTAAEVAARAAALARLPDCHAPALPSTWLMEWTTAWTAAGWWSPLASRGVRWRRPGRCGA